MWIRSQDREQLKEGKNFKIDDYVSFCNVELNNNIIGKYKSKERALEVLDEIQTAVLGKILIPETMPEYSFEDAITVNSLVAYDKIEVLPIVFEMPQE